jgi:hypothetical protein
MACWFNPANLTHLGSLLTLTASANDQNYFTILFRGDVANDPVQILIQQGGGNAAVNSTSGCSANTWHHACAVFTSATSRTVYLDGGNSATNISSSLTPSGINQMNIGSYKTLAGYFLNGQVAEVGLWSADLTQPEIASLAKGMTCDKVRPQSLVFYAPLVRDLIDAKGGLTITNNNTATVANHPRVYA